MHEKGDLLVMVLTIEEGDQVRSPVYFRPYIVSIIMHTMILATQSFPSISIFSVNVYPNTSRPHV